MNLIIQHYFMKQHFLSYLIALLLFPLYEMQAAYQPEFSTAGFYELANSGREVYSMNPAWRFHKGTATGAETTDFNDQDWKVVSLPDGIEYVPTEASGCINYQGEVWYRKHFTPANELKGKNFSCISKLSWEKQSFCKRQFIDRTLWRLPACSH